MVRGQSERGGTETGGKKGERMKDNLLSCVFPYKGTNLIVRAPPLLLCLNLIPKDSIPNTIILSVRVSAYESVCVSVGVEGGDTVQSKAQK